MRRDGENGTGNRDPFRRLEVGIVIHLFFFFFFATGIVILSDSGCQRLHFSVHLVVFSFSFN